MQDAVPAATLDERHRDEAGSAAPRSASGAALAGELLDDLRDYCRRQGLDAPDEALRRSLEAATGESPRPYAAPRGPRAALARAYVSRRRWGRPALLALVVLALLAGAYFLVYRPYATAQGEAAEAYLHHKLPAEMDALYETIFDETKVQTASDDAATLRDAGRKAALAGDRAAAEQAVAALTQLHETLEQNYTLRVVDSDGVKPGFWTFPQNNAEATNYYIVVEAIGPDGKPVAVPVTSETDGSTSLVSRWGLRVPQAVYEAVMADKADDGIIQHNLVGAKQDGFLDLDYYIPVLGGTVTQW